MPSTSGPTLATTSPADLALVRAIRAFGGQGSDGNPFAFLAKFAPNYRERIIEIWFSIARVTPELAWQTLLRDHRAAIQFDPARVHPSWFARILAAESPAIQTLVRARAPEPIRAALHTDSTVSRPAKLASFANDAAVEWALSLWAERLVGDVAESPDDPPVILALSQFSLRELTRLVRFLGQAKLAFALGETPSYSVADEPSARTLATDRVRIGFFRRLIGPTDPRLVPIARNDFDSIAADRHRKFAAVGLLTVGRLLRLCDPHRARWAIQHIPYPVAKRLGALGNAALPPASQLPVRAVRAWEAWIFEAAWARLLSENRLESRLGRSKRDG